MMVLVNGIPVATVGIGGLFSVLLRVATPIRHGGEGREYTVSSLDALKGNLQVVFDLVKIYCDEKRKMAMGKEKAEYTRMNTRAGKCAASLGHVKTVEGFARMYYNLVLSLEKLGTLGGFGLVNEFGDPIYGNPEKTSVVKNKQLTAK